MSFRHGKLSYFSIGTLGALHVPTNISSYLTEVSMARPVDTSETSTFGSQAKTFVIGLYSSTFTTRGRWDDTLDAIIAPLLGLETAVGFCYGPGGNASGRRRIVGIAYITDYSPSGSTGDMVGISLNAQVTGAVASSTFAAANQTTTVAVGSNAVNTSTFQGSGSLSVAANSLAAAGVVLVGVQGTAPAVIIYTGGGGTTTLTGCTTIAGGGVLATSDAVNNFC